MAGTAAHPWCDGGARDVYAAQCPCREILDLLANKWTALAIGALEDGPRRFGELRRRLEGVSPKVLSATMRRLGEHGLVERVVYPEVPPRVEYALTPLGEGAVAPLAHLRTWIEENIDSFTSVAERLPEPDRTDVKDAAQAS